MDTIYTTVMEVDTPAAPAAPQDNMLYNAFTFNGNLTNRWLNYGVKSTYDPATETIEFTVPEGWTDTMCDEDRAKRKSEWCVDDPTLGVQYHLEVKTFADGETTIAAHERVEKICVKERNLGRIEFHTSTQFKAV